MKNTKCSIIIKKSTTTICITIYSKCYRKFCGFGDRIGFYTFIRDISTYNMGCR
ncbi:MAG: hypothetical protein IPN46_01605 [Saprospiraceae bacterium]|nr:hypothetical protein [Saprospiraceae bacterium]